MLSIIVMASILVAVVIGYKMKINVGFIAIAFSGIFGSFVLHMKANDVIAQWPTYLFFFILSTSLYFGLAVTNGTMGLLSEKLVYTCRRVPWAIPIVMWILSFTISGLGAGLTTVFAFMPPIILNMAESINMDKRLATTIVVGASVAGGYTPISLCYVVVADLIRADYAADEVAGIMPRVAFNLMLTELLIFVLVYLFTKSWKLKSPVYDKAPAPFNAKQLQTLGLTGLGIVILVVFPVMKAFMPQVEFFSTISAVLDPALVFAILLAAALVFRLGDEKATMNFVPWGTIIMVSGAVMLIGVAKSAGAIDFLANLLSGSLSPLMAKVLFPVVGGFMSMFSGGLTVVAPMLLPLVPSVSAATGVAASTLITGAMIGAHLSGVSPFSTGGAMTMAGERDETKKDKLFVSLMAFSVISLAIGSLLVAVGIVS